MKNSSCKNVESLWCLIIIIESNIVAHEDKSVKNSIIWTTAEAGYFSFKQTDQVVKEAVLIYSLSVKVDVQCCGLELGGWGGVGVTTNLECQAEVTETNSDWLLSSFHYRGIITSDVGMKNMRGGQTLPSSSHLPNDRFHLWNEETF